ncbi:MAG: hypothetical protein JRJ58_02695 [Deltaproteobacteria bacterium]|nr:hypothetical protein [Deltaproteobacteria bacterium]
MGDSSKGITRAGSLAGGPEAVNAMGKDRPRAMFEADAEPPLCSGC